MTQLLYYKDPYQKSCNAQIIEVNERGIVMDQTIYYVHGGGQPGDSGEIIAADNSKVSIVNTLKDRESGKIIHVVDGAIPNTLIPGTNVTANLDWARRHKHMRMHSCLHLLCALIDAPVTGGSIGIEKSRLDFDLPEVTINKDQLTEQLQTLIMQDHPLSIDSISDEELDNNPDLVRTMSVKPPTGQGSVRLININTIDLQPCGGTHVRSTAEIGSVRVSKIEKKGRQNRRVNIVFCDPS